MNTTKPNGKRILGLTLKSVDDIEAIYLIPHKISRDNDSTPDKHIDCEINVAFKDSFLVRFLVTKPGEQEEIVDTKNYYGNATIERTTVVPNTEYPEILEQNGITYKLTGWYNEAGDLVTEEQWQNYKPSDAELANGKTVNFYAHYEPVEYDLIVKKTLSGNMYNANDEFEFTVTYNDETEKFTLGKDCTYDEISIPNGAKVTIMETNAEGYEFSVASTELTDLDGYEVKGTSVTFTMPANNVSIVIDNKKGVDIDTGVFLDTLPYILILGVAAAGAVVLVKRRKHSDD